MSKNDSGIFSALRRAAEAALATPHAGSALRRAAAPSKPKSLITKEDISTITSLKSLSDIKKFLDEHVEFTISKETMIHICKIIDNNKEVHKTASTLSIEDLDFLSEKLSSSNETLIAIQNAKIVKSLSEADVDERKRATELREAEQARKNKAATTIKKALKTNVASNIEKRRQAAINATGEGVEKAFKAHIADHEGKKQIEAARKLIEARLEANSPMGMSELSALAKVTERAGDEINLAKNFVSTSTIEQTEELVGQLADLTKDQVVEMSKQLTPETSKEKTKILLSKIRDVVERAEAAASIIKEKDRISKANFESSEKTAYSSSEAPKEKLSDYIDISSIPKERRLEAAEAIVDKLPDRVVEVAELASLSFKDAMELHTPQLEGNDKLIYFCQLAEKYGNENPTKFLEDSALSPEEKKALAFDGATPEVVRKSLANELVKNSRSLTTDDLVSLSHAAKGEQLTKGETAKIISTHELKRARQPVNLNDLIKSLSIGENAIFKDPTQARRYAIAVADSIGIKVQKTPVEIISSFFEKVFFSEKYRNSKEERVLKSADIDGSALATYTPQILETKYTHDAQIKAKQEQRKKEQPFWEMSHSELNKKANETLVVNAEKLESLEVLKAEQELAKKVLAERKTLGENQSDIAEKLLRTLSEARAYPDDVAKQDLARKYELIMASRGAEGIEAFGKVKSAVDRIDIHGIVDQGNKALKMIFNVADELKIDLQGSRVRTKFDSDQEKAHYLSLKLLHEIEVEKNYYKENSLEIFYDDKSIAHEKYEILQKRRETTLAELKKVDKEFGERLEKIIRGKEAKVDASLDFSGLLGAVEETSRKYYDEKLTEEGKAAIEAAQKQERIDRALAVDPEDPAKAFTSDQKEKIKAAKDIKFEIEGCDLGLSILENGFSKKFSKKLSELELYVDRDNARIKYPEERTLEFRTLDELLISFRRETGFAPTDIPNLLNLRDSISDPKSSLETSLAEAKEGLQAAFDIQIDDVLRIVENHKPTLATQAEKAVGAAAVAVAEGARVAAHGAQGFFSSGFAAIFGSSTAKAPDKPAVVPTALAAEPAMPPSPQTRSPGNPFGSIPTTPDVPHIVDTVRTRAASTATVNTSRTTPVTPKEKTEPGRGGGNPFG